MNELPSATFRKTYAKLREPVRVTVNGHVIGTWTPSVVPKDFEARVAEAHDARYVEVDTTPITNAIAGPQTATPRGAFAAFRPVPKPGKR